MYEMYQTQHQQQQRQNYLQHLPYMQKVNYHYYDYCYTAMHHIGITFYVSQRASKTFSMRTCTVCASFLLGRSGFAIEIYIFVLVLCLFVRVCGYVDAVCV